MDSFGHVNNVVYFRYFENARVEYFQRIGWWDYMTRTGIGPDRGSTQARFRRPVKYPDTLRAGAKVVSFGTDRFTIRHVLVSRTTGELVTEGDAVVVASTTGRTPRSRCRMNCGSGSRSWKRNSHCDRG